MKSRIKFTKIFIITGMMTLLSFTTILASTINLSTNKNNNANKTNNTTQLYKSNKEKTISSFISKERILDTVDKKQFKSTHSKVKSAILETWKQHMTEDNSDTDFVNLQISDDRMVWVVKTSIPDEIITKAGTYKNATLITVFDSETANLLESTVTGDYQGKK